MSFTSTGFLVDQQQLQNHYKFSDKVLNLRKSFGWRCINNIQIISTDKLYFRLNSSETRAYIY